MKRLKIDAKYISVDFDVKKNKGKAKESRVSSSSGFNQVSSCVVTTKKSDWVCSKVIFVTVFYFCSVKRSIFQEEFNVFYVEVL